MAKFKSRSGARIFRQGKPVLVVPQRKTYETNDKDEIRALKASPEVEEVKG